MSRSGYNDDCDDDEKIGLYRQAVDRSIRGKRGQAFLREMAAAMDAMPAKELIAEQLVSDSGEVCAIGAVCQARGLDVSDVDYEENPEAVAEAVGIATALAAEIQYWNDEGSWKPETPAERWQRMRKWVAENIRGE
jgi:hypothetical protein